MWPWMRVNSNERDEIISDTRFPSFYPWCCFFLDSTVWRWRWSAKFSVDVVSPIDQTSCLVIDVLENPPLSLSLIELKALQRPSLFVQQKADDILETINRFELRAELSFPVLHPHRGKKSSSPINWRPVNENERRTNRQATERTNNIGSEVQFWFVRLDFLVMWGTSLSNNFLPGWWQQRKSLVQQRLKRLTREKQARPFNQIFALRFISRLKRVGKKSDKKQRGISSQGTILCTRDRERVHQGLNKLSVFCLRFCRAKAYINSKTDEGEKEVFVSFVTPKPTDFVSSTVLLGAAAKRLSSVWGRSLKRRDQKSCTAFHRTDLKILLLSKNCRWSVASGRAESSLISEKILALYNDWRILMACVRVTDEPLLFPDDCCWRIFNIHEMASDEEKQFW